MTGGRFGVHDIPMNHPRATRLELADWLIRLGELAQECALSGPVEEAERLREMLVLLQLAPAPHSGMIGVLPDPAAIEAQLRSGAALAAALALLGEWAGYMLSRGPGGRHMATVAIRSSGEASGEGESAALALLGALAAALARSGDRRRHPRGGRLN